MDYKEKYEMALEKARVWKEKSGMPKNKQGILDDIFPELKESEDERIRKGLIKAVSRIFEGNKLFDTDVTREEALAWLEKQGNNINCIYDKELSELLHIVICRYINDPDISYSERENVSKKILPYVELLEKQGEQKASYTTLVETGNGGINALVTRELSTNNYEEKPADRVEPKFKVGDWIVNNISKDIFFLKSDNNRYCSLEDTKGNIYSPCLPFESDFHLWTIQDAKDGDVLVASDGSIFIFNSSDNNGCKFYVALTIGNKLVIDHKLKQHWETSTAVHPATKKQCDTLTKAMLSLGYTFDFDKKELKKNNSYCKEHCKGYQETGKCFADGDCKDKREAERKSTWSEDDEYKLNMCITAIETYYKWDSMVDWLKSLKQRIGG